MKIKHVLWPVIAVLLVYQCSRTKEQITVTPEQRAAYAMSGVVEEIKRRLRDPKSLEIAEESFEYKDNHFYVTIRFRSRNGFGGMDSGVAKATTLEDGTVTQLDIIE